MTKLLEDLTNIPDYGIYKATDEDIIQFLKGKSSLYSLDDDKSFYEINHEDEVELLVHLIEQNKVYVIKPF